MSSLATSMWHGWRRQVLTPWRSRSKSRWMRWEPQSRQIVLESIVSSVYIHVCVSAHLVTSFIGTCNYTISLLSFFYVVIFMLLSLILLYINAVYDIHCDFILLTSNINITMTYYECLLCTFVQNNAIS